MRLRSRRAGWGQGAGAGGRRQEQTRNNLEEGQILAEKSMVVAVHLRLLFLLFSSFLSVTFVGAQTAKPKAVPQISATARFRGIDGQPPINLDQYRGRVIVLVLWATWCAPCRRALLELNTVASDFPEREVSVIALSTEDPQRAEDEVLKFAAQYNMTYKVGWIGGLSAERLMAGADAIPQIFIVKDGVILNRFIGWKAVDTPTQLRDAIKDHLSPDRSHPWQQRRPAPMPATRTTVAATHH